MGPYHLLLLIIYYRKIITFRPDNFQAHSLVIQKLAVRWKSIKIDVSIKPFLELFSVAKACLCDSGFLVLVVLSQGFEIRLSSPVLIPPKTSGVT